MFKKIISRIKFWRDRRLFMKIYFIYLRRGESFTSAYLDFTTIKAMWKNGKINYIDCANRAKYFPR